MIIRKPYAFLIKHFKIIHLLLLVPLIYLAFKFGDISSFFNRYINANYQTSETSIAGNYITLYMYLSIIVLIIINIIIFLLMKSKGKSTIYYSISIIYYLISFIATFLFYTAMASIETGTITQTLASFAKDISVLFPIPYYILVVATFVKGIGFNIKTLRFDSYLGIQVSEYDDEEIEIKINSDNASAKKRVVHYFRELKYYILENKFVFSCLGIAVLIGIFIAIYMDLQVYNKRYNFHEAFALDSFNMTLKESYISDVDYKGKKILDDYYYLAVKISITNKSRTDQSLDKGNFRIYLGKDIIYPKYSLSGNFIDIGTNYQGETIKAGSTDDYVFVYELTDKMLKSSYKMKILSNLQQKNGKLIPSYRIINIKPTNITKVEKVKTIKTDEEIVLTDTMLGNTIYKLKNFNIARNYSYTYDICKDDNQCKTYNDIVISNQGKILVIIEDEIKWDDTISYYKNSHKDIYEDYGIIAYKYQGNEYQTRLTNVTPTNLKGVKVYEVPDLLSRVDLSEMKLFFKIRNKVITIEVA